MNSSIGDVTTHISTISPQASQAEDDERAESPNGPSCSVLPSQTLSRPLQVPTWRRYISSIRWFVIDQWFLLAFGCLIVLASQIQVPRRQQHKREIMVTYLCVAVIFIVTGCTLPTRVLLQNYSRWKIHLFVQGQSFIMTSVIIYGVVSLCATNPGFMDPGLLCGFIFLGCVPTTISSNVVMTKQAHGNQALTVVESTLGNLLGPFITPLLVEMYLASGAWYTEPLPRTRPGEFGELYRRVFKQLGLSMLLPLACGQIIQNVFPTTTQKFVIDFKLAKIGSLSLLIIIWQTFDQAFQTGAFSNLRTTNIIFMVFISILFYLIWISSCFLLSIIWLSKRDAISVAYCVPAKTPAMGVPLSNVMFTGISPLVASKLQIPMVVYQGFQVAAGSLMTLAFRKWIRPDEDREDAEKETTIGDREQLP